MPSDGRTLLAIDSSTPMTGMALYDGETCSELIWNAGRNQTTSFTTEMMHLLDLGGLELRDIGAIGVAIGPGSFNGLRVGMSVVKGLCYGLACQSSVSERSTLSPTRTPVTARPFEPSCAPGVDGPYSPITGIAMGAGCVHRISATSRSRALRRNLLSGRSSSVTCRGQPGRSSSQKSRWLSFLNRHCACDVRPVLLKLVIIAGEVANTDSLEALEPIYVHGVAPSGSAAAARK